MAEQVGLVAQLQQDSPLVGVVARAEHPKQLRAQPAAVPRMVVIIESDAQFASAVMRPLQSSPGWGLGITVSVMQSSPSRANQ